MLTPENDTETCLIGVPVAFRRGADCSARLRHVIGLRGGCKSSWYVCPECHKAARLHAADVTYAPSAATPCGVPSNP